VKRGESSLKDSGLKREPPLDCEKKFKKSVDKPKKVCYNIDTIKKGELNMFYDYTRSEYWEVHEAEWEAMEEARKEVNELLWAEEHGE